MKKINFKAFVLLSIFALFFISCDKDDDEKSNGLTDDINNLVPQSVLDEMEDLGLPIYTGTNPPNVELAYHLSPFVLKNSNVPTDYVGMTFADMDVQFYDQNNDQLTVKIDYVNGPESGNGLGGFIVGKDNKFTVFAELNVEAYGQYAQVVMVFSGKIVNGGVEDAYAANFMIDDNGDPGGYFIEEEQGRVIYDQDGFSEEISSFKSYKISDDLVMSISTIKEL